MPESPETVPASALLEEKMKRWVEGEVRETRHTLRNDFAALGAKIEAQTIASTREHIETTAIIRAVEAKVDALQPALVNLEGRVEALEDGALVHTAASTATDNLRKSLRTTGFSLGALIISAAGLAIAFAH